MSSYRYSLSLFSILSIEFLDLVTALYTQWTMPRQDVFQGDSKKPLTLPECLVSLDM